MSDDIIGGATASAAPTPSPVTTSSPPPAATASPTDQSGSKPAAKTEIGTDLGVLDPAASKTSDADGFDWRAAMSRGDQKKLAKLSRYADMGTLADALFNAQEKISKGVVQAPGEGAAPEEIAAYRQSLGIPETPEAYSFPGDFGDTDKPVIDGFKAIAHAANMAPAQVEAVAKWYGEFQQQVVEQQVATNNAAVRELRNQLIEEMGPRDFERGAQLANQFLSDKGALDLASMKMENGVKLGAHHAFVKLMMGLARDYSSDDLVAAVEAPNSQSVDARIDEIMGMMNKEPEKYRSKAIQDELMRLTGIQETRAKRTA
jgi:hypothetical protein